ncbi:universal stress protein [Fundicoccus culcitae]|uniref:Universal stress protein n=1 Tax=Fundicoccus culcitae TaxID=2969821 RepID=A0ABY5P4F6_9LACT|nr:universal stress protein [Fundicoccus culcitae]UUX33622.1 universal stress protein [Fundicoccus culcitae]
MFGNYKNILVPVDGSPQSRNSFKKALEIAKRNQARIHIVFVIDNRSINLSPELTRLSTSDFAASFDTSFVDRLVEEAQAQGLEALSTVESGSPADLIGNIYPKSFKSDLIVIAATGKGAMTRAFVGSVSNFVSIHAPCDVLIVKSS